MALLTWLEKDGEIVFAGGSFVEIFGSRAIRQRLENRIKRFLGGFFTEPDDGIDWIDILGNQIDESRLELAIRAELEKDEFVKSIDQVDATIDRKERSAKITFSGQGVDITETLEGEVII